MVDQTGQDPVEVQAAADVARHPAEGVGAVEPMGGVVDARRRLDDRPRRRGELDQQIGVDRGLVAVRLGADRQDAPRRLLTRDRDRDLANPADAVTDPAVPVSRDRTRVGRARPGEGRAHRAVGSWQIGVAARSRRARCSRDQAVAAQLVDGDRAERAALSDHDRRLAEDLVERLRVARNPGEGAQRREIGPPAETLAIGGDAPSVGDPLRGGRRPSPGRGSAAGAARPELGAVLRGGQEPLEVAESVAAVAAWVDPVVAESSGVAPRPYGVGMDAQQAGGLRHREGGVDRAGKRRARHGDPMEEMSSRRGRA
jgi:hypothetical protein